jgi:hypothetical protein
VVLGVLGDHLLQTLVRSAQVAVQRLFDAEQIRLDRLTAARTRDEAREAPPDESETTHDRAASRISSTPGCWQKSSSRCQNETPCGSAAGA